MNNPRDEQFMIEYEKCQEVYYHLCAMQNIDDIGQYSLDWYDLARRYDTIGATHNSEAARARGEYYGTQAQEESGEYIRIIELPFAELIPVITHPVPPPDPEEPTEWR